MVEVYRCPNCGKDERFPRYNHPQKLLGNIIILCLRNKTVLGTTKICLEKKSEPPAGIEPSTSQKLVRCSNHWAMGVSYSGQVTGLVHFSPVYLRDVKSCDSPKITCHLFTKRVAHGLVVRASYWHLGQFWVWFPLGAQVFFSKHFYVVPNTFSSLIALEWLLFYILLIKIMQLGLFNYGKFWDSPRHRVLIEYYCLTHSLLEILPKNTFWS